MLHPSQLCAATRWPPLSTELAQCFVCTPLSQPPSAQTSAHCSTFNKIRPPKTEVCQFLPGNGFLSPDLSGIPTAPDISGPLGQI